MSASDQMDSRVSYLEQKGIDGMMTGLLATLGKEQPDDPISFLISRLSETQRKIQMQRNVTEPASSPPVPQSVAKQIQGMSSVDACLLVALEAFDHDSNGTLEIDELSMLMVSLSYTANKKFQALSKDSEGFFKEYDKNKDNRIQLEELKSWFASNNFELSDAQDLALTAVDMAPKILQLCRFMRSNQK